MSRRKHTSRPEVARARTHKVSIKYQVSKRVRRPTRIHIPNDARTSSICTRIHIFPTTQASVGAVAAALALFSNASEQRISVRLRSDSGTFRDFQRTRAHVHLCGFPQHSKIVLHRETRLNHSRIGAVARRLGGRSVGAALCVQRQFLRFANSRWFLKRVVETGVWAARVYDRKCCVESHRKRV